MSVEKNMVADLVEEAIPAATYVPENEEEYSDNSGSSADFEGQVNQIIGDNVESSTRRENLGMAECEYSVNPMKSHSLFTIHSEGTSSGKPMTTMVPGNNLENQDINLKELLNPCEMMKAQRTERRTSERIQEDIKKTMGNSSSQKRSLQGIDLLIQNSFSALDNETIIQKANDMGAIINHTEFQSIDLLRELEKARFDLHKKATAPIHNSTLEPHVENILEQSESDFNYSEDESSSLAIDDDFIPVLSKRNRKSVRRLSLSGRKPPKTKHKENPSALMKGRDDPHGIHESLLTKKKHTGKMKK